MTAEHTGMFRPDKLSPMLIQASRFFTIAEKCLLWLSTLLLGNPICLLVVALYGIIKFFHSCLVRHSWLCHSWETGKEFYDSTCIISTIKSPLWKVQLNSNPLQKPFPLGVINSITVKKFVLKLWRQSLQEPVAGSKTLAGLINKKLSWIDMNV